MSRPSVLVIFVTVFIDLIGFGIIVPLVPVYSRHYGASERLMGIIVASFSAMQFLFAPVWRRWSDRIGRRPVLLLNTAGAAVFTRRRENQGSNWVRCWLTAAAILRALSQK